MPKITPCFWFDNNAEDALNFYASVFKSARILSKSYYGDEGPGPKGMLLTATLQIEGQEFMVLNGGPYDPFTHAISFIINCETQDEVDWYWDNLLAGGQPEQCGWLKDKFGLSWQIVPTILGRLLQDKDTLKSGRVMQAMLQMVKIDIDSLKRAYEQE